MIVLCLLYAGRAALLQEVTIDQSMEMIIGLLLLSLLGNLYWVALIETFETAIPPFGSDLIKVTLIARIIAHLNWLLAGQRLQLDPWLAGGLRQALLLLLAHALIRSGVVKLEGIARFLQLRRLDLLLALSTIFAFVLLTWFKLLSLPSATLRGQEL